LVRYILIQRKRRVRHNQYLSSTSYEIISDYNYVHESLLEDAPKIILIPETKEISNEYESLDRPYILNDDIFSYIVAHEMIEHDDIEPCSVEECQQEQIGLNKQSKIIILFDK